MAYYRQEDKKEVAPKINAILKQYGVKGSLSIQHNSMLVLTIHSGGIDFIANADDCAKVKATRYDHQYYPIKDSIEVNIYHTGSNFSGIALECLDKLITTMNEGNYNNSDVQTDYFDVGFYVAIKIGKWDKPYKLN